MTRKLRPWIHHLQRALAAPGNLIVGAGALAISAVTWNPLPLILYGLGEPVWLYSAATSQRYARLLLAEERDARLVQSHRSLEWLHHQLRLLLAETPCGDWTRRALLPDYTTTYARLIEMRNQIARIVAARSDTARTLEEQIVVRLDDMLRAYLTMARARLLFHCAMARVYPQLPELAPGEEAERGVLLQRLKRALIAPAAPTPAPAVRLPDAPFVSFEEASREVRDKIDALGADSARNPGHEDVYRPIVETLEHRLDELQKRGKNDLVIAAQLAVFPDQFEIIASKMATQADVGEIVGDMRLLLDQTDDTVEFAEQMRASERSTGTADRGTLSVLLVR